MRNRLHAQSVQHDKRVPLGKGAYGAFFKIAAERAAPADVDWINQVAFPIAADRTIAAVCHPAGALEKPKSATS